MNPIISIIVPVYNVEEYLQRCIDSILNQSFKNFELILVNDGSTDNSLKICKEYLLNDPRVKIINKENGGLSSARNAGINIAKGRYIGFVDSDDWINKEMYKILYELCEKNNSDIAECRYTVTTGNEMNLDNSSNLITILNNEEAIKSLYTNTSYGSVVSWNKLYRCELFKDIKFPEGKLNEDQFTTYKLYYKSNKIVSIDKVLYYYFQSTKSIMRSEFTLKKLDAIEAIESSHKFFEENNLYDLVLWNDTLYSFVLIKYFIILLRNEQFDNKYRNSILEKFRGRFWLFIKNEHISIREKLLLMLFYVSPKLYIFINKIINGGINA